MIPINKGAAPQPFVQEIMEFRETTGRRPTWDEIRCKRDVLSSLLAEQGGICAYCMSRILDASSTGSVSDERTAHVEHLLPQSKSSHGEDIDYRNMVAVCSGERGGARENSSCNHTRKTAKKALCCDRARGTQDLAVNPTHPETLRGIRYRANGTIYSEEPSVDRDLTSVLNLNDVKTGLPKNRKAAIERLYTELSNQGKRGGDRAVKAYCRKRLEMLSVPGKDGRFPPYVGALRYFLQRRLDR